MGNAAPWVICRKAGLFYFSYYHLSSVFETTQICSFLQLLPSVRIGQRAVGLTTSVPCLGGTDAASSQSLLCTSIFLARDWERAGQGMSCFRMQQFCHQQLCFHGCKTPCTALACIALSHPTDSQRHTLCWEGTLGSSRGGHPSYGWLYHPGTGFLLTAASRNAVSGCYPLL